MCCAERVSYQMRLAPYLTTWRRDKAMPTVTEVALSFLDEVWSRLWPVINLLYLACTYHFEMPLRMSHSSLVGWRNVEIFSIMPAHSGGLYPVLPPGGTRKNVLTSCLFRRR